MIPFEFTRPWTLLALVIFLPVLYWFFVRSLSDFPHKQRRVSLAIRSIILLLLIFSLAGLVFLKSSSERYYVFLVDQSTSVSENGVDVANKFLDESLESIKEQKFAFLPFGATTGEISSSRIDLDDELANEEQAAKKEVAFSSDDEPAGDGEMTEDRPATPEGRLKELQQEDKRRQAEKKFRDGTDIASAIETAAGFLPPGYVPEIVLLSDGNETLNDALVAANRSRFPINCVPLPTRSEPEVQVSAVNVPSEVREGEPFFVEVIVQSNHEDTAKIEVYQGDIKVIGEQRKLKVGENRFRFQQSVERARLAAYTVRVSGMEQDTLLDNNMDTGLVYAAGKPRVLIIESDPNLIRDLAYSLEEEGIESDVRPPQGMPETLADLQNYELLILSNVPATSLSQLQMEMARTYVQELGGGLIMLGGEQSFGLGGYYKTALEEVLPVRSDFEKEKETPSIAMMLVIDKSGSMGGEKIEMAKSAARGAAELLGRRDKLGVLAFDGDTFVISELQSARNKGKISDDIARIDAGGGTVMYPAMDMAYQNLLQANAKLKHVILLTDGISAPGDFEGLAQEMVSNKITVSTVAVGSGAGTDLLESIARYGKGRYYFTEDAAQVPQIFAKETVTASKSAIDEQPFLPQVVRATHALADLDMDSAPFLLGYVMTRPKPTCEVILSTEKGDPLLAWWRYGLGMTVAFTSDAKSRWAAEWMTWEGFGKFWTQVIRHAMRKSDARGIIVSTDRKGNRSNLRIDAVNELGQYLNQADVELTLIDPQLKRHKSNLLQSAPGRYTAAFDSDQSGAYHLEIALKKNDKVIYRQSRGMNVGYSDELRIQPTNETLLRKISEVSGGVYSPSVDDLVRKSRETASRPIRLWPYLCSLAAALLLIDVALRRVDFSLHWPFSKMRRTAH